MIKVKDLKKSYDEIEALSGISFSVKPGEIIGLLGPNGAGKTTIMKILTGFLHPTSGTAKIGGLDITEHPRQVQEMIGYLPENAPLYPELTVQSQLKMVADLRNIPPDKQQHYLTEAIRAVGLEDRLTRRIGTLSKGYRQRVGLAQAILHKPKLLILDEPTNGLDPTQIIEVRHLIQNLAHRSTVMLSTHILSEVEATCDRAIIIMAGELKADARLSELSSETAAIVTIAKAGDDKTISSQLAALSGAHQVETVNRNANRTTFRIEADQEICPAIYQLARDQDWALCELRPETKNLETVFNQLTTVAGGTP